MVLRQLFFTAILALCPLLAFAQSDDGDTTQDPASGDTETTDPSSDDGNGDDTTDPSSGDGDDSKAKSYIKIPNGFSPNGDDINDVLRVTSSQGITEFRAIIFNRWGHKVYEWDTLDGGWDGNIGGRPAKQGTYFVLIKAKGSDGETHTIRRDVNLLRGKPNDDGSSTTEQ